MQVTSSIKRLMIEPRVGHSSMPTTITYLQLKADVVVIVVMTFTFLFVNLNLRFTFILHDLKMIVILWFGCAYSLETRFQMLIEELGPDRYCGRGVEKRRWEWQTDESFIVIVGWEALQFTISTIWARQGRARVVSVWRCDAKVYVVGDAKGGDDWDKLPEFMESSIHNLRLRVANLAWQKNEDESLKCTSTRSMHPPPAWRESVILFPTSFLIDRMWLCIHRPILILYLQHTLTLRCGTNRFVVASNCTW
jgi:hypothetical protein